MKYYLIAGEASGDLHGSKLIKGLKAEDPGAEFRFWGGSLMAQAGGTLVRDYREGAVMGLTDRKPTEEENRPTVFEDNDDHYTPRKKSSTSLIKIILICTGSAIILAGAAVAIIVITKKRKK